MTKKKKKGVSSKISVVLMVAGIATLLVGFTPEIAAVVNIDTTPPGVYYHYPYGAEDNPNTLDMGMNTLIVDIDQGDSASAVWCIVTRPNNSTENVTLSDTVATQGQFRATFSAGATGMYKFVFHVISPEGTHTGYGVAGADIDGDFYINNIGSLTTTSEIRLTTRSLTFKFVPTVGEIYIISVKVYISGAATDELTLAQSGSDWIATWEAPRDGTYSMNGYAYSTYNETFSLMTILAGMNEDPTPPPGPWTMYDYTKVLGVGLIAVGLARQGWQRRR